MITFGKIFWRNFSSVFPYLVRLEVLCWLINKRTSSGVRTPGLAFWLHFICHMNLDKSFNLSSSQFSLFSMEKNNSTNITNLLQLLTLLIYPVVYLSTLNCPVILASIWWSSLTSPYRGALFSKSWRPRCLSHHFM